MVFDLNYKDLAKSLYDEKERGVIVIPEFLPEDLRELVNQDITQNRHEYIKRPERYGKTGTRQELSSWDNLEKSSLEGIVKLINYHKDFTDNLFKYTKRDLKGELSLNSSTYDESSYGIGPHRDNSYSRNLVAIYVINGTNDFYTANNKKRENEFCFPAKARSMILMRAPRDSYEEKLRPVHYVENIESRRDIMVFREIDYQKKSEIDEKKRFN